MESLATQQVIFPPMPGDRGVVLNAFAHSKVTGALVSARQEFGRSGVTLTVLFPVWDATFVNAASKIFVDSSPLSGLTYTDQRELRNLSRGSGTVKLTKEPARTVAV